MRALLLPERLAVSVGVPSHSWSGGDRSVGPVAPRRSDVEDVACAIQLVPVLLHLEDVPPLGGVVVQGLLPGVGLAVVGVYAAFFFCDRVPAADLSSNLLRGRRCQQATPGYPR